MAELSFAWDPRTASANLAKHQVSFDEAKTVLHDEAALVIQIPTTPRPRRDSASSA